ncbi:MAG: 50S ribosomal protein L11 methyltransferase [Steroidobacteraceae bacterium]|jgi:ribosomal protein L11 methyltransferase|nr:50S ribosomal protein L11 methyltransferase [Steroidobacteraceae bacterium]
MPVRQLVVELGGRDPEAAQDACLECGALAVTLADAADDPVLEPAPGETPLWPTVRLTALLPDGTAGEEVARSIAAILGLSQREATLEQLEDRPWEREWLKDFRPMRFGRRLWICPGGQPAPDPGAVVVELDPGLAFGTGTHPTTAMCLEWLDGAGLAGASVLDYGCGSGILALAALALGAGRATAVDIDPQALIATRENAARNRLAAALTALPADDLAETGFDVVVANILSGPLVDLAPRLARLTRDGGRIVLAGLLDEQAADVARAYEPWFDIAAHATRSGWTLLAGRRRAG